MNTTRIFRPAVMGAALAALFSAAAFADSYEAGSKIQIGGTGHWDLVVTDSQAHRAYVAHNVNVEVVDTATSKHVDSIHVTGYAHGLALVPSMGVGFVTVGKSSVSPVGAQHEVDVFDLKSLKIVSRISTAEDPDAITYDSLTKRIYLANADASLATVIDAATRKIVTTIPLGGHPEFPISDGAGHVFYNINDKNKVVVIDARKAVIVNRWSLGACDGPTAIAYDAAAARLLIPCDNGKLVVLNARSGDVVATVPTAEGPDGVGWDPETHTVFVATLKGAMTVASESDGHYAVTQTLKLPLGSRTLGLDEATHRVYVPSSSFGGIAPGQKYPTPVPGTFALLVVSRP